MTPPIDPPCAVCSEDQLRDQAAALCQACSSGTTPSPCIQDCRIDPSSGLCSGCLRTGNEVQGWARSNARDRSAVYARILDRRVERPKAVDGPVAG